MKEIKTWTDVAIDYPRIWDDINELSKTIHHVAINEKVANKICATIKIETLIELGYGRIINNKEWEDDTIMKYNLENIGNNITYVDDTDHYSFVSFRTNELREEFMSHEENVKLVKQYFMMQYYGSEKLFLR